MTNRVVRHAGPAEYSARRRANRHDAAARTPGHDGGAFHPPRGPAMITAYFAFAVIAYFTAVLVQVADAVAPSDSEYDV